jgi:hypothetical protein
LAIFRQPCLGLVQVEVLFMSVKRLYPCPASASGKPAKAVLLLRITACTVLFLLASECALSQDDPATQWWVPGEGGTLPAFIEYGNEHGRLGLVNHDGPVETKGHPFFEPIGTNGRACVTCHQPADGMSISLASIRERWEATGGKDPLFAAIDGANCPNLPQGEEASHSLLLERGLFRIFVQWPPVAADGSPIDPEFELEVVRDPTGCNTSEEYGLNSEHPMVSVYRRPRVAANLRFVATANFGVSPFIGKNGMPAARDPETGKPVNMNIMADAREPTLRTQAQSAATGHMGFEGQLSKVQLDQIEQFERQLYAAQNYHDKAGNLGEEGGPSGLGVNAMVNGRDGLLGNNISNWVFPVDKVWHDATANPGNVDQATAEFRESVARGHDVFMFRTFWIKDAMHINTVGLGNPTKRTCSTCHGGHLTGLDAANGWMDLGTTNLPWALEVPVNPWEDAKPQLPLFKLTCKEGVDPHPFLGRVIYTQDPGRALISGRCDDIGTIVIQQMRGLAGRAPYFANGSASDIRAIVDFYDRRFNIGYTEQDREDLINFLSTL